MKRTHVHVGGPLAPYAPSFVKALEEQGYGYRTACDHLYLMAQLSRWLEHRGLALPQLTPELGEEFVAERRRTAPSKKMPARRLEPLAGHLVRLGVLSRWERAPDDSGEQLLSLVGAG
jgi:hypothetical protein